MLSKEQAINGLKENLCSLCAYGSQNMDTCNIRECDNRDYIKALEQPTSDDCVSRQAVLDILSHYAHNFGADNEIKALPPVTPTQRWIPVSEKLPASDEDVLVTNGKEMYIGWINPTDKCWIVDSEGEYFMNDIVAWQPLPKPYEEKRGDLDGSN